METVLVGASASSETEIGFSGLGFAILLIGAVLVDMNFGGSSTLGATVLRFIRIEGGATDLRAGAGDGLSDELGEEDTSGLSLMVFLAAEEAEAVFGETGIRFKAAVSVFRIFSGSLTPPGALLSVSAIIKSFFRNS